MLDAVGVTGSGLPDLGVLCSYTFALFPPLDMREEEQEIALPAGFRSIDSVERPDFPAAGDERRFRLRAAPGRATLIPHLVGDEARTKTLSKLLNTAGVSLRELRYFVVAA